MGKSRREAVACPVCGGLYRNVWWHMRKTRDQGHLVARDSLCQEVLGLFGSDTSASKVAERFPFGKEVVLSMWREAHGPEALRLRGRRLQTKPSAPCRRCGESIHVWAEKYCSPFCANAISTADPKINRKRSRSLQGRKRPESVRKAISKALLAKVAEGTLPAMQPEVRARQKATKRLQRGTGILTRAARAGNKALNANPEARARRDASWVATLQDRYGVSHLYDIPGVRERANQAKSEAMSRRIAAGLPTGSPRHFKRGWHHSPVAGLQWFQSSWEQSRMETLDAAGVLWTKAHGIRIPYTDTKGRHRYYVPDFRVELEKVVYIEEVKGYKGKNFLLKTAAAETWCTHRGWVYVLIDSREGVLLPPLPRIRDVEERAMVAKNSQSGKARKARQNGSEVVDLEEMWGRVGGRP